MRSPALILAVLLGSLSASAQAPAVGPVTTATKIAWDLPNVPSAAIAQSYEARTSLDGVRATPSVLMANVSCAASVPPVANQVTCQATLPQALVDALAIAGKHALVLRMYDPSTKLESPDSTSLAILAPPAAPTGIRISVGP